MARPKKEGMDYFPHDTDAVNDEKIEALRMLYGNDGYAFYFILLERIYRTKDFELDVSDAETIQILAKKVDVTPEKFSNMLETAIKRGCFDRETFENDKVLTSEGIKKRASVVVKKRVTMRNKYAEDISDGVSEAETIQKVHKVKESKEKKSKEKESRKDGNNSTTAAANPIQYYESNIGLLSPMQMEELWDWNDQYQGETAVLIKAMNIAMDRNKKNMGFIKYLLKDWRDKGAKSLSDVEALEVERFGRPGKVESNGQDQADILQQYNLGF